MPEEDDFAKELRGDDGEEPMNAKGGFGQAVLAGLIVAAGAWGIGRVTDNRAETTTAAAIATLTERVSTLTDQVKRLNEQPYVRREEFNAVANRVDGLDQRLGVVERAQLERRQR